MIFIFLLYTGYLEKCPFYTLKPKITPFIFLMFIYLYKYHKIYKFLVQYFNLKKGHKTT